MTESHVRRAISGTAVLLLHLGLLGAFLLANYARTTAEKPIQEIEIRFPAAVPKVVPAPSPALQPDLLSPTAPVLPANPQQSYAPSQTQLPPTGAISGVGRALFGCDPQKLDTLPPKDRAACLRLPSHSRAQQSVRLGPPPNPNSPFTKEIEERFRDAAPINRPCALGSFNDVHGLPCFSFDEKAPLLPHR